MDNLKRKIKILDIQLTSSSLYIVSILITLLLTYNQKLYTTNKKTIFDTKETYLLSNFNRLLILGIVLSFLYSSYSLREISKKNKSNIELNDLDVFASVLSVISALIALYITYNSPVDNALDIENPNI